MGLHNGEDIMAILPTGFGKNVFFQLFTLVKMKGQIFFSHHRVTINEHYKSSNQRLRGTGYSSHKKTV